MRRALVLLLLGACSSGAAPVPGQPYPGMPGAPGYPPVPGVPGAPVVGYPGQVPPGVVPAVPGAPMVPGMPGVAPVAPLGQPTLAPASAPAAIPPGFRQITGPGFSFAVPAAWNDIPPPLPQVVVAARDTTPLGQLFVNANLVTEPFPVGDGAAYAQANILGLGSAAQILGNRPASVGGRIGADIEARWTNQAPPYRTLQRVTTANGTGYVLTCTADDSVFEQARATCNAVLDSFRVGL